MQKTSFIVGLMCTLAFAGVTHAQRGGFTREQIATALPLEGAPLDKGDIATRLGGAGDLCRPHALSSAVEALPFHRG